MNEQGEYTEKDIYIYWDEEKGEQGVIADGEILISLKAEECTYEDIYPRLIAKMLNDEETRRTLEWG